MSKCDFCQETENVKREVFIEDGRLIRVYQICPSCVVRVYQKALDMLMKDNEKEIGNYMKSIFDAYFCDVQNEKNFDLVLVNDNELNLNEEDHVFNICEIERVATE